MIIRPVSEDISYVTDAMTAQTKTMKKKVQRNAVSCYANGVKLLNAQLFSVGQLGINTPNYDPFLDTNPFKSNPSPKPHANLNPKTLS